MGELLNVSATLDKAGGAVPRQEKSPQNSSGLWNTMDVLLPCLITQRVAQLDKLLNHGYHGPSR